MKKRERPRDVVRRKRDTVGGEEHDGKVVDRDDDDDESESSAAASRSIHLRSTSRLHRRCASDGKETMIKTATTTTTTTKHIDGVMHDGGR